MIETRQPPGAAAEDVVVTDAQLQQAEHFIEEEEGAASRLRGFLAVAATTLLVAMSLFHLYAAVAIVPTQTLRPVHVGFVLFLSLLLFPVHRRFRDRIMWFDWILAALGLATIVYLLAGGDDFFDRNTLPNRWDLVFGIAFVVLVLEACRRTSGWVMPLVVGGFIVYAFAGQWLPGRWAHRGYDVDSLVGVMYMTLEGVFGTAVDVSSSLIILFTIYGAFLQHSGAGKFFLDFSFAAMGGKATGAGRTVVLSSFLLGGPSGSGVATTVTIGSVAYPMLAKSGYGREAAGGLLAAGGLGAIISPPVLGAAAFLIAEFLKISYLDVLLMATIPTCLYYFSLFLMVELDARKFGLSQVAFERADSLWSLSRKYGFHFLSLLAVVVFLVGIPGVMSAKSPAAAVFWATVTTFVVSFFRRDTALLPPKLLAALKDGAMQTLNIAATCAAAGIIVGVVGKTGLGLNFSEIVIDYAGGSLFLTAAYTALVVWVVGLAVPVTASYIICAVVAAPALIKLGVPDFAAHMFIFYYAVLSEVSPPTALSPFAAAAITGGDPYKTTLQSWKYTAPAFLVPFAFVVDPAGIGLLLKMPPGGDVGQVLVVAATALTGIIALAGGLQGWWLAACAIWERVALVTAGLLLVYPATWTDLAGIGLFAAAALVQLWKWRRLKKG